MVKKQSGPTEQLRRSNKVMSYGDRLGSRSTDASTLGGVEQPLDTMTDGDNKHKTHRSGQRRIRGNLELGISILQHVEGQLNRADSKAQFTLTLDALLIASSAFLGRGATSDVVRIGATTFSYRIVAVLGIAMFITLLISTIYALVAVIPRFTPENMANNNIFYFGNIVQQERKDFAEHYFSQSNREIERMLMSEIHDLAGIAKQKFALIRISYIFLFASLGFWSIVQMIILLIR